MRGAAASMSTRPLTVRATTAAGRPAMVCGPLTVSISIRPSTSSTLISALTRSARRELPRGTRSSRKASPSPRPRRASTTSTTVRPSRLSTRTSSTRRSTVPLTSTCARSQPRTATEPATLVTSTVPPADAATVRSISR